MIVVGLSGGLGNQMFQYAAGRALALRRGTSLGLDISHYGGPDRREYGLDGFAINAGLVRHGTVRVRRLLAALRVPSGLFAERRYTFDPDVLDLPDGTYLRGYFQSERYFADAVAAIRADFRPVRPPTLQAAAALKRIDDGAAISLHIRRGDYVNDAKVTIGTLGLDYYRRAADALADRLGGSLRFFVFSDEPGWARRNLDLPFPTEFVEGGPAAEELRLMAACRHHVIANSSFSWWGAWLNPSPEKIVIAPARWHLDPSFDDSSLVPPTWLRL